jgi:hypothetical protein
MTKIKIIPSEIVKSAEMILNSKAYSSSYRKEVIRQILGSCETCGGIPSKYYIDKNQGVEVIRRYCSLHG